VGYRFIASHGIYPESSYLDNRINLNQCLQSYKSRFQGDVWWLVLKLGRLFRGRAGSTTASLAAAVFGFYLNANRLQKLSWQYSAGIDDDLVVLYFYIFLPLLHK
jgi:hypothetical protein